MAAMASTGKVTLPAFIEVGDELVRVGDIEVAVDIRAVRYEVESDGYPVKAVLDLSVED
ncbi:hypothetical protein [Cellulomonas hominis]|uniref:hypothetical protein n=1 Tax=Cellulomonas hominis TaxID=156981 RepID=UPI0014449AAA|nr:hypothetical protein [Cellulomonas hominis]NKY08942.1 hypothetical protein [Cellulomonas hominis]